MKRREDDDCVLLCVRYHRATQRERRRERLIQVSVSWNIKMK